MSMEEMLYLLLMRRQYQASLEYKIPDVPTDEELKNLPKDSRTFDCVICLETVPFNTIYTFNCDHQVCCPCARNITSKYCPLCRADTSSSSMTKKKIEEVEAKFSQLDQDEEFARKIHAELNGEENVVSLSDDDDVVIIETKESKTTQVTTKTVVHKKRNLKDDNGTKTKGTKRSRSDEGSDDEWKPASFKRVASKNNN